MNHLIQSLSVKKSGAGTVYKLIAVGLTVGFLPIFTAFGVMGAFGLETLMWNKAPVTGFKAIFVGPLMAVFMSLLFTAILGSVIAFGLWLFSFFKPITIEYTVTDTQQQSHG